MVTFRSFQEHKSPEPCAKHDVPCNGVASPNAGSSASPRAPQPRHTYEVDSENNKHPGSTLLKPRA